MNNNWQAWREMDSRRRRFGFILRKSSAELYVGRRLYRCTFPWHVV